MNDDDIQQIFFVECEEALEATEDGLDACRQGTHDSETINAIFRGVHSIKGGAGAFGHSALQAYTHCFENLLGDVREGDVALTDDLTNLLLRALDLLRDHVDSAKNGDTAPDDAAIMEELEAARAGGEAEAGQGQKPSAQTNAAPSEPEGFDLDGELDALLGDISADTDSPNEQTPENEAHQHWFVHIRPHAGAMDNGAEPLLWLRELELLGGKCSLCEVSHVPSLDRLIVDEGYLGWTFQMPGSVDQEQVEDIFDFAGEDCSLSFGAEAAIPQPSARIEEAPKKAESAAVSKPADAPDQSDKAEAPEAPEEAEEPEQPEKAEEQEEAGSAKTPEENKKKAPKSADRRAQSTSANQSVRIDLSKLDKLIDGVGELVIAQAMLAQRLENASISHIEELAMLDTLVRDIQERAMAFRAQPISSVFGRVPRLLRELSTSTGKDVRLEVAGETTELDKTVIERLSEPMTHLIRNAVDHGIETPEERVAARKPPQGTLSLSAEQKAGRIVISISDDGRGINREKVLAKAIENGVVSANAKLTDDEINLLIFEPGFSTAASVTSVSGRGVGMDVVKSNVRDLGGRITLQSEPGEGTTFSLALPLTLAISDGMIVRTGDQSLVIPLAHVIESLRPQPSDIKGMGTKSQMLNVRGQFVPIISLGKVTEAASWENDPCNGVLVLVETESHGQAALLVDAISDQRQFVIKTLDTHYRSVEGVAGATILGDGQVALIVDIDHIVQSAKDAVDGAGLQAAA